MEHARRPLRVRPSRASRGATPSPSRSRRTARSVRLPGWDADAPYLVVPSLPGPTPLIYSSEEALTYLDPAVLTPRRPWPPAHLLAGREFPSPLQHLHPAQDPRPGPPGPDPRRPGPGLSTAGRYTLDWLPVPLRVENRRESRLRSGRRPVPDEGSRTRTSCASASCRARAGTSPATAASAVLNLGRGRIVLVHARLIERLHIPACAAALECRSGLRADGTSRSWSSMPGPRAERLSSVVDRLHERPRHPLPDPGRGHRREAGTERRQALPRQARRRRPAERR